MLPHTVGTCALAGQDEGAVESAPSTVTFDARDGACRPEAGGVQLAGASEATGILEVDGPCHHSERRPR